MSNITLCADNISKDRINKYIDALHTDIQHEELNTVCQAHTATNQARRDKREKERERERERDRIYLPSINKHTTYIK